MTTVTFTATGTWTAPAGVTTVDVQCWGEGGNGGSSTVSSHSGGGGGGGEYAENTSVPVTPSTVYSFTIGSGGTGTSTVFTGDSSTTVTAHAGGNAFGVTAGSGGTGSAAPVHQNGGSGGSGADGALRGAGGGGGSGGSTGAGGAGGNALGGTGGASGGAAGSGSPGGAAGGNGGNDVSSGSAGASPGGGSGGSGNNVSRLAVIGAGGQVTLTYTASTTHSGTASLSGTGTMTALWVYAGSAGLSGTGTMTATGMALAGAGATLSGTGTMTAAGTATYERTAALSGVGVLTAFTPFAMADLSGTGTLTAVQSKEFYASLSGTGTLSDSGIVYGRSQALSGTGTLTVLRVLGVVTAGAARGPVTISQAWPGSSQVAVSAPGSSRWYWLGTLGDITALTYSFVCPGGCDQMSATVMVPAGYRTQMFDPGWTVEITRGGHQVWSGKLDEPQPGPQGWTLTAVGAGNLGQNFVAFYTSAWPSGEPDQAINAAITRGLPWVNPGVGTPAGAWFGQGVDPGAQTIADLLNLTCSRGGLLWYVNSQPGGVIGSGLSVTTLPTVPNRLLIASSPVARTLGGDINTIFLRYQASADNSSTGAAATYGTVSVSNSASIAMHGAMETYADLSDAGVMTATQAQNVGAYILEIYQRASYNGPFTAHYGDLLNLGGQPIDPGTDQAGTMVQLILTDFGFGGEVTPQIPVQFIVGAYSWDDFAQAATITPYQVLDQSMSGLLQLETTLLQPVTVSGG